MNLLIYLRYVCQRRKFFFIISFYKFVFISFRKIPLLMCIFLRLSEQSPIKPNNETKFNIVIRTLLYKDKQGRLLLATGPLSSHVERTVREHLRNHIDFENVDQIRIEPIFRTIHDIPKSKNETLYILKKLYPYFLSARINTTDTPKIMNDMRRNSKFYDQAWFYNVVSMDFSPLPTREGTHPSASKEQVSQTPTSDNHVDEQPPIDNHVGQSSLPNTDNADQTPSNYSHSDHPSNEASPNEASPYNTNNSQPSPNNTIDLTTTNDGSVIQYDKQIIDETTSSDIVSGHPSHHENNTNPTYQDPVEYDTTPTEIITNNEPEPPMKQPSTEDVETTMPAKQPPADYEPPTNMFPDGRPRDLNPIEPPNNKVNGPPTESGSNGTLPASNEHDEPHEHPEEHHRPHGGHSIQNEHHSSHDNSKKESSPPMFAMSTRNPFMFVPNDIFYAIEKRCANWSDDCQLNSPNRFGSINRNVYPMLPPKMIRWE